MKTTLVKEIMVPLSDYAIVLEDDNLLEAVSSLKKAQEEFDQTRYRHRAIIVFDKDRNVVGKLSQHDVIEALEPDYKKLKKAGSEALHRFGFSDVFIDSALEGYSLWSKPLMDLCRKAISQRVKDVMYTPAEGEFIGENDSMDKAIHQLIIGRHHSLLVTSAGGQEIVGVLRLTDVFQLVSDAFQECESQ